MAEYLTDFSEYTTGVDLSDWTDFWSTGDFTYNAVANSGTFKVGTKFCHFNSSGNSKKVATWDDVGSVSDVRLLAKFVVGNSISSPDGIRLMARVGGSSSNEDCYYLEIRSTYILIRKYVGGVETGLVFADFLATTNTEIWLEFYVVGTSLKARAWEGDCVKPNDWLLETTDSDLSSGRVGIGNQISTDDFYCDYFGANTAADVDYPPSGWNYNDAFACLHVKDNNSAYVSSSRCMGGQFLESGRKLSGVGVYCVDHSDDIRVAVYSGGSLSAGPSGATLLKDFGKTSGSVVDDYVKIFCDPLVSIPSGSPLWIVIKGDNSSGFSVTYSGLNDSGHAGNYQVARGRGDVNSIIGNDPDVVFAGTFPAGSTSFSNYWFDFKIYLDGHPDTPSGKNAVMALTGNTFITRTQDVGGGAGQNQMFLGMLL